MADIRRVKLPNGTTYNIKDNTARSNINNIVNGTTKLPYGKSLSITNSNELNLLDPNDNILSTVNLPNSSAFKHAHFEYVDVFQYSQVIIDESDYLNIGDLVYITQLHAARWEDANAYFCKSNDPENSIFYMNSGNNKAYASNDYVYSISTRYDYIVKVIDNTRGNGFYDFEIIAGGPKDDLMNGFFLGQTAQPDFIPALGQTTLFFESDTNNTTKYLKLYDENDNQVTPTKENIGILANGKVILQYTCSAEVAKVQVKTYSYMPNFVICYAVFDDAENKESSYIVYTDNDGIAEGTFVSGDIESVYLSGASSWELIFVCDYAYPKIL